MSFIEQERALFDLLFNAELREAFLSKRCAALSSYALTPQELADFEMIRPDACLLYTSPSPRDQRGSRMPSSA